MSGVDVLATVRELADFAHSELTGSRGDLSGTDLIARSEQAVVAVAELMEAAQRVLDKEWEYGEEQVHCARLNAALARVQGGAA